MSTENNNTLIQNQEEDCSLLKDSSNDSDTQGVVVASISNEMKELYKKER